MKVTEGFSDLYSSVLVKMKSQRGFWDIVVGVKNDDGEENLITYTNTGELVQRLAVQDFMLDVVCFMGILKEAIKIHCVDEDPENGEEQADEIFNNFNELKNTDKIPSEINEIYNDGISLIGGQLKTSKGQQKSSGCGCWLAILSSGLYFYEWWLGIVAPIILTIIFRPRGNAYELMLRGAVAVSMLCQFHPLFKRACISIGMVLENDGRAANREFLNQSYVNIHGFGNISPVNEYFSEKDPDLINAVLNDISDQRKVLTWAMVKSAADESKRVIADS